MKKNINLFFILLFSLCSNAQNKETTEKSIYRAIYSYQFQRDSLNINNIKEAKMELLIGKYHSLFQSLNTKFNDSLYNANKNKIINGESSQIFAIMAERKKDVLKYKILKQKNKLTTYSNILVDRYKYNETTNFKWQILNDTLTLNSFKCNKAITNFAGRSFIAWFTRDIPISDGPYKFNGLPGLIIKLKDTKNQHVFNLISLKKIALPISILHDTSKPILKVSKTQFFKAITSFKENPLTFFITRMNMVPSKKDPKKIQQYKAIGKRYKANEIELKIE